jgi:hypothetical protein
VSDLVCEGSGDLEGIVFKNGFGAGEATCGIGLVCVTGNPVGKMFDPGGVDDVLVLGDGFVGNLGGTTIDFGVGVAVCGSVFK